MVNNKKSRLFLILVVILFSFCSCNLFNAQNKDNYDKGVSENMSLSDRQIEILKEKELPTSYDELNELQKDSIMSIEEMFVYLENKYNETFEFVEYVYDEIAEAKIMTVKVKSGTSLDLVKVEKREGILRDNYSNVLVKERYENQLAEFFSTYFAEFKIYSEVNNVSGDVDENNLLRIVNSSNCVFIKSSITKSKLAEIVEKYSNWYAKNILKEPNCTTIYLTDELYYNDLTRFNYKKKLSERYVETYFIVSITKNGNITII